MQRNKHTFAFSFDTYYTINAQYSVSMYVSVILSFPVLNFDPCLHRFFPFFLCLRGAALVSGEPLRPLATLLRRLSVGEGLGGPASGSASALEAGSVGADSGSARAAVSDSSAASASATSACLERRLFWCGLGSCLPWLLTLA